MSDVTANQSNLRVLGGGIAPRPAPATTVGVVGWLRENLFSSLLNTILTILSLILLYFTVPPIIEWAFLDAFWTSFDYDGNGEIGRNDCRVEVLDADGKAINAVRGACWMFVAERWEQLLFGDFFKDGSLLRPTLAFIGLFIAVAPMLFDQVPGRNVLLLFAVVYPLLAIWLLSGTGIGIYYELVYLGLIVSILPFLFPHMPMREPLTKFARIYPLLAVVLIAASFFVSADGLTLVPGILTSVDTHLWGGLLLTMVIGVVGIVLSLPIGVVLALGRRSHMPAVKLLCVIFIEFIRGVPLITLLFMASNMLPLFFPEGYDFDKLVRALIVVVMFSAAYMAEVIRGGLQAIPKGQYEAADALGLSYWKSMYLIILPQALKIVIPGIVNSFIGLFKDTTLVLIIGLFDILNTAKLALTDAKWIGSVKEAYAFVALVYFIFCFAMSRYSIWLEGKLETGHKR